MGLRMTERGGEAGSDAQGCSGVRGGGRSREGAWGGAGRGRESVPAGSGWTHDWSMIGV